jgi:hypothetical protein
VKHVEILIVAGDLRASKEVLEELQRQDDDLYKWAKGQPALFVEDSEVVQEKVTTLMDKYLNPDKLDKGINGADPFVIGLAMTGNPAVTVVSGEKPGSKENPKIPYVCGVEGIPHATFLGLIQFEGWKL